MTTKQYSNQRTVVTLATVAGILFVADVITLSLYVFSHVNG